MPRETQAETFIGVLTELWNEDRERKNVDRRLRLQANVRRFVKEFRIRTGHGRYPSGLKATAHRREKVAERQVAAE